MVFDSIDGAVRCAVKVQQQVPNHDAGHSPDRAIRFRIGSILATLLRKERTCMATA